MIETLAMIERAGLQQLRHPIRSARPRRCCGCKRLIGRGERHISAVVRSRRGKTSDRRIHYACQPERDPFPPATRFDWWIENANRILAAAVVLATAFGTAIFILLVLASG